MTQKLALAFCTILAALTMFSCQYSLKEKQILALNDQLVDGWLAYDSSKIMGAYEDFAMIQPDKYDAVTGKPFLKQMWFPTNGGNFKIRDFALDPIDISVNDTLGIITYRGLIDYEFTADSLRISKIEKSIGTALYRKQFDNSWKIWRQMWTNIEVVDK
jgi:ketosteroid isomerase-like protein